MKVCFPDTMGVETRWQTAFYEMDIICNPSSIYGLEDGYQGLWWPDKDGVPWYLMKAGTSSTRPLLQPVRRSRRPRGATPGARRA